jgi:hypothetical protein
VLGTLQHVIQSNHNTGGDEYHKEP